MTAPYAGAEVIGSLDGWLVLLLSSEQLGNGSWSYRYSVQPGRVVTVTTIAGPDSLPPTSPVYLEMIRDLTSRARARARIPAVPDDWLL